MIKAILFDMFETLISQSVAPPPRASSLGEALGLDPAAFRTQWKLQRPRVVRGQLSFHDALMEIGPALGVAVDPTVAQRICDERIRANAAAFATIELELVSLTRDLCQKGIRLAVVSNCFTEDVVAWPTCALAPQFASAVFSFAVGLAKPDPRIYLEATQRLGVNPADALFIGDGADEELAGAEHAGLRAAQALWFLGSRRGPSAAATIPPVSHPQDVLRFVDDRD